MNEPFVVPWLPPGRTVMLPGRGETFAWEGPLGRTTFYRRVEERAAG